MGGGRDWGRGWDKLPSQGGGRGTQGAGLGCAGCRRGSTQSGGYALLLLAQLARGGGGMWTQLAPGRRGTAALGLIKYRGLIKYKTNKLLGSFMESDLLTEYLKL